MLSNLCPSKRSRKSKYRSFSGRALTNFPSRKSRASKRICSTAAMWGGAGTAVRRQAHHLVLMLVGFHPQDQSYKLVDPGDIMIQTVAKQFQTPASVRRGHAPIAGVAHRVCGHHQHVRHLGWGRRPVKGPIGMGLVMVNHFAGCLNAEPFLSRPRSLDFVEMAFCLLAFHFVQRREIQIVT